MALTEIVEAEFTEYYPVAPARAYKEKLANASRAIAKLPQASCPTKHFFAPGVYVREIFMPAGAVIIGKIHKTRHLNIIQQGKVALANEDGTSTILGPCTFMSDAGVQKALLIIEDTVWSTVHVTELRDLESLEAQLIEDDTSYPSFDRTEERNAITQAAQAELLLEHK